MLCSEGFLVTFWAAQFFAVGGCPLTKYCRVFSSRLGTEGREEAVGAHGVRRYHSQGSVSISMALSLLRETASLP
jgi:hypothetical protein